MEGFLKNADVPTKINAGDFLRFMPEEAREELIERAASLAGKKVVHVNATAQGGGVAEILQSLVPYIRSLGMECDWHVVRPDVGDNFFAVTNAIHNALQGQPILISEAMWAEYERVGEGIAAELDGLECDVLAINDPQPLLAGAHTAPAVPKVYFSHIDTSTPHEPVWEKLFPLIASYDRIVFSNTGFVNASLSAEKIRVFTPAIDPLSPKQRIVPKDEARHYLAQEGRVPASGPLIVQVSRFDVWKNPLDVIRAFSTVRASVPDASLALVGFNDALDNPAAASIYEEAHALAERVPGVFLFYDVSGVSVPTFTMMAQNAADVVVQNSTREGFGLTVAEAMWKRKPVVGGPAAGVRMQIRDGENGYIVEGRNELSERIIFLLTHPEERRRLGEAAHETVRRKFLFPRLANDHLALYQECLRTQKA